MFNNFSLGSSLSIIKILNSLSKTLQIAKNIIPIYNEVSPFIKKTSSLFKSIRPINNNYADNKIVPIKNNSTLTFFK